MYEVILYAAIATIVCAVLYSVLGRSSGDDPSGGLDPITFRNDVVEKPQQREKSRVDSVHIEGLNDIMKADPSFVEREFLDGAQAAYSMILEAFAEGDRDTLKGLLSADVYAAYETAIDDREAQDLTQVTDLARLQGAKITDAGLGSDMTRISVKFNAEISSALIDAVGQTVSGDPDMVTETNEVWTFERPVKSKSPEWVLCEVEASDVDFDADPTPDTKP